MSINSNPRKILVILGPTASGKTKLAVRLAVKFNGEIVSADSRQVYRGMDVGTGKDLEEFSIKAKRQKLKIIKIPYHLINVANPKKQFSLAQYQKSAYEAIDDILQRGKLPILVGGSGLYLQAVVDGYRMSDSAADKELRQELAKMSHEQLYGRLKKINHRFALRLNQSDNKNKRRLIRYIELSQSSPVASKLFTGSTPKYESLCVGLSWPKEKLRQRIYQRLIDRLEKEDMIGEVMRLHQNGLSWKKLESFGLEYRFISFYLQKKISYEDLVKKLNIAIRQFAKKQLTWFRRWEKQGRSINWLSNNQQAEELIRKFTL